MNLDSLRFFCLITLFCILCNGRPVDAQETTRVIVVSTHHFVTEFPEGYTPGHLRALLNKFDAEVVAVEAPSNADDPWSQAPPEISKVVKPWAKANQVEVVPIGWNEADYAVQVNQMLQELHASGKVEKYQQIEQRFQKSRSAIAPTCQSFNSDGHHQVWRDYHRDIHELNGETTPWEKWNEKILENVVKTCTENSGKRIAVVIGAAHSYFLLDGLASEPNIKVVRADQFLPLAGAEVKSATQPLDYLHALHPLNLNALPAQELRRLKSLLDQLQEEKDFRGDYQLFLGKYLLHERKPKEALAAFEALGAFNPDVKSKFDERIKLFETGLVYTAVALFQSGDRATAVERLQNALRDEKLQVETRNWAQQVLRMIQQSTGHTFER